MKIKIHTVPLFLSFLVIFCHEVIPHHHHEPGMGDDSHIHLQNVQHEHRDSHHHHSDTESGHDGHSNKPEKDHQHSFPYHEHLSSVYDFDCFRIQSNGNIFVIQPLLILMNSFVSEDLKFQPPEIDFIRLLDKHICIDFSFEPGAPGLRGPPSHA